MDWMRKAVIGLGLLALLIGPVVRAGFCSERLPAASLLPRAQSQSAAQSHTAPAQQPRAADDGLSVSDELIQHVLEPLRTGMQTGNIQMVLSIFDNKELSSYSNLQAQLAAFFEQFNEVRLRYQLLQVTADKDRASAVVEIDMDALPYDVSQIAVRRTVQMRLQLKLGPKGWKVSGFTPSDFFNVEYGQK